MANVLGAFRAGVEEHWPMTVINDWNLNDEDQAGYRVLILATTACLDARQADAVRQFVRGGGGLVARLDVSLFDEFGNPRDSFALADVLGVDYRGLPIAPDGKTEVLDENFARAIGPGYWEKRKSVFDFRLDPASFLNQGRMATYVGSEPVTFKGPAVRVAPRGAKVVATLRARGDGAGPELPGVLTHEYGKGRVVYLAAGLDAAYYLYAYPYQRLALGHAVRWAAAGAPPVRVEAPMCVHSTVMRQGKGGSERLIVHLYSDLNTTAFHALPADDVPLREEVVPVHDIRVTFDPGYRLRRVHLEPEGRDLELQRTAEGTRVMVPRLDVHAMVVGELEDVGR